MKTYNKKRVVLIFLIGGYLLNLQANIFKKTVRVPDYYLLSNMLMY